MSVDPHDIRIRPALSQDLPQVLAFIRELAVYEHLEDQVVATEADLVTALFGPRPYAEVAVACLAVLDWNKPSIGFYLSLGAVAQDEWTTFRLTGAALERLAGRR
jgi:hypothetical protein